MAEHKLEALVRSVIGNKRAVRRLRKQGFVPGVVYGPDIEPLSISIRKTNLIKLLHEVTEASAITLNVKDDSGKEVFSHVAFIKNVQYDKLTDEVKHIDFYVPEKGHKMNINIPIEFVGKPKGVEKGGVIEVIHHELPVETLPSVIIEKLEIDISNLNLGESLHVSDLKLPEGMEAELPENEPIITVAVPRGMEVEGEETAEEPVEPEVIEKGKKEEE
ncbi:50S ribosomal protein L25 [Thermosipho affectus]|uniref:Large ribosomal subunit protein bL25 n=1 Tax=Thermosipho affectus TaxID=660294 RepID=A0ABX3IKP6_9BACT|nr:MULTISPECIES: 50S ribosomal protein L25 [Thermosipho]ANQ53284.1 50S ribosomal protein L25 [Thermosipho sp. 1070]APT71734.1 50S ribosomal protein L25 [Thermosipho sp. 1063]ONN27757.1 50S ribosomal protein L25 [Thermosipho affectus]OOC45248.1 50S ribosomal protein L25 [Thermosipho sp. 1074]